MVDEASASADESLSPYLSDDDADDELLGGRGEIRHDDRDDELMQQPQFACNICGKLFKGKDVVLLTLPRRFYNIPGVLKPGT